MAQLFARCSLLFACCLLLLIQLLWAIAWLLVTRVTLIYLVDEFFIFSFLVLLKEMRTRGGSKISFCCLYVSCKSRKLRGRGSPRFPCVTSVVESAWDILRAVILLGRVAYKTLSNVHDEVLLWNNQRLSYVDHSHKKSPLQLFDRTLKWSFQIKSHKIISFRIISNIIVTLEKVVWLFNKIPLHHRYFPSKFLRFW